MFVMAGKFIPVIYIYIHQAAYVFCRIRPQPKASCTLPIAKLKHKLSFVKIGLLSAAAFFRAVRFMWASFGVGPQSIRHLHFACTDVCCNFDLSFK